MSPPSFRVRHEIPEFRALWVGEGQQLYGCRGRRLLLTDDWGRSFQTLGEIPPSPLLDLGYATRLSSRLLRLGLHYMCVTRKGTLVLVGRKVIYRAMPGRPLEAVFEVPRGTRPLNVTVDDGNRLYFGEYFGNADRQPVSVYCSDDDGKTWHVTHTFEAGRIRHVHGIQYDPYRKGLWIMTGDDDDEAFVGFTRDGFRSMETVSSGSQAARVVSGVPTPEGLLCGTDTPREANYLLHLGIEDKSCRRLTPVQSSVFYCHRYRGGYVFATTAEPSPVNDTRNAHLWFSVDGEAWHDVATFEKDRWSMRYFQFGQLLLPAGDPEFEFLVVSPVATTKDGTCLIGDVV